MKVGYFGNAYPQKRLILSNEIDNVDFVNCHNILHSRISKYITHYQVAAALPSGIDYYRSRPKSASCQTPS